MGRSDDKKRFKKKISGHGSLTKAGKVRDHTPERGRKTVSHPPSMPRKSKRNSYWKRVLLPLIVEEACRQFEEYMDRKRGFIHVIVSTPMGDYEPSRKLVAEIIAKQFSREPYPDQK